MKKIGLIATRDIVATVSNKGFIIGLLIMPAMILLAAVAGPRIMNAKTPQVQGSVAVIDRTGVVTSEMKAVLDPAAIAARRTQTARRAMARAVPGMDQSGATGQAIERAIGSVPSLQILPRPAEADLAREKDWLIADQAGDRHLAVAVFHPDAVKKADGQPDYGAYDLYVAPTLDESTESAIHDGIRQALITARLKTGSLDQAAVETMMNVPRPSSTIVGAKGEQQSSRAFTRMMPVIMGVMLFMGVMLGGQTLMTSTIEEKSSRVVEVLLAAASPLELMTGKLIGQLAVGLLVIAIYVGLGLFALYSFAMLGLVDPMLIVYLLAFFLITYLIFGTLMMAIGAAVNQIAEAQSLMGPVMLLLIMPYMMAPMIGRAPNSTFAVAVSFIPPINTFAMMARLASNTPPPAWQVGLTMLVGLAAAAVTIWFAAKVFKIGLLMHGKPPDFATLIRWARMA